MPTCAIARRSSRGIRPSWTTTWRAPRLRAPATRIDYSYFNPNPFDQVDKNLHNIYDADAASSIAPTSANFARGAPVFAFAFSAVSIRRQSAHDVPSP